MAKRVQKVVLRGKIRRQRWGSLKSFALVFLKVGSVLTVLIFSAVALYRFCFFSDFFKIRAIEIEPVEGERAGLIANRVLSLKGVSIFRFSARDLERKLSEAFSEVRRFDVGRSFPDRIKIGYVLRVPVAYVNVNGGVEPRVPGKTVDEEGVIFEPDRSQSALLLPQLSVSSPGCMAEGLKFIKMWSEAGGDSVVWTSTHSQRKVSVSPSGEVSLYSDDGARIVWGEVDSKNFSERFARFKDVWSDLQARSMRVQYINLREVPQKRVLVLGDHEIVGRVIVRPVEFGKAGSFLANSTKKID